ncbi:MULTISPECIES: AraC family transcriptional regulator [Microbulbifer]|uniref:AraC family transcriptional regulator n=1 Tax=Microbulbifer TaxID=48073 RepID=UPI001E649FB4|nr:MULTISPECIES: AraC family transcriptional regulator [Microbulbifer]UHQ54702.1 AraC family transcriptional regulator [Microbulbifer sp. YPW16]
MQKQFPQSNVIDAGIEPARRQLASTMLRLMPTEGMLEASLDGLAMFRADTDHSFTSSVYEPSMCFVVQGSKSVQFGDREIKYGPLNFVACSVHIPVTGKAIVDSPESPHLGIRLNVDPNEVSDLVLELGERAPALEPGFQCEESSCGMRAVTMNRGILDALGRLVALAESPEDAPILAPLARRELLYRVLMSEMGPHLRKLSVADSQSSRVSRVIGILQERYAEPLRIRELADHANMSESSLYHSFKQVTRMSPLQFQKKLRLHEARRLMLAEGLEAASASYRVGYESPSHFSREYSRMFGAPPRADVNKLRGETPIPA